MCFVKIAIFDYRNASEGARIVRHACIYVGEEVVVTLGKQKDRTHMKTKTKMSAVKVSCLSII